MPNSCIIYISMIYFYIYLSITANLTLYLNNALLLLSFIMIMLLLSIEFIVLDLLSSSIIVLLLFITAIVPIVLLWVFIARSSSSIIGNYSIPSIAIIVIGAGQIIDIPFLLLSSMPSPLSNWSLLISPVSFDSSSLSSDPAGPSIVHCYTCISLSFILCSSNIFGFFISTIGHYHYIDFHYHSSSLSLSLAIIDSIGIYLFDSSYIILFISIFAATIMIVHSLS